jgi:4-hydroxybenzoate polyprenyltransferase
MAYPKTSNNFLIKILSLFSLVRGYNIIFIIIAQIVSSIFIFSGYQNIYKVIFDLNIWLIILSTSTSISAGYIINNFYDSGKDLINRPLKTFLEYEISGSTKLYAYVILNFLTLFFSLLVSLKAFIFFGIYSMGIFLYSIKISKYLFLRNFLSVMLVVTPFFAITVYYKNFSLEILTHAIFLFFVILIKELIKDLENIKGDFTMNYKTIPVVYGEKWTKIYISLYIFFVIGISINLIFNYEIFMMKYFYVVSIPFFIAFSYLLWKYNNKKYYETLHNLIKTLITVGIFSIILRGL